VTAARAPRSNRAKSSGGRTDPGALTVVKLGGSLLESGAFRNAAIEAIARRFAAGSPLVVVHGGGKRVDAFLSKMGIPKRIHRGLRVTDERTLDVVVAVLAGFVNKSLVGGLSAAGVPAAGLSGADGGTLRAEIHPPVDGVDLGRVGRVASSDPRLVRALLGAGFLPVVASVAIGPDSGLLNVNADAAASALAAALGARRLVFFTDVEGVLDDRGRLIDRLGTDRARALLTSGVVTGGMLPKLAACLDAAAAGVAEIQIAGPSRHASVLADGTGGTSLVAA